MLPVKIFCVGGLSVSYVPLNSGGLVLTGKPYSLKSHIDISHFWKQFAYY